MHITAIQKYYFLIIFAASRKLTFFTVHWFIWYWSHDSLQYSRTYNLPWQQNGNVYVYKRDSDNHDMQIAIAFFQAVLKWNFLTTWATLSLQIYFQSILSQNKSTASPIPSAQHISLRKQIFCQLNSRTPSVLCRKRRADACVGWVLSFRAFDYVVLRADSIYCLQLPVTSLGGINCNISQLGRQ